MDSITQACVGAVIGELCLGKQLGWRAPVWGACVGTIPDLDIIANPWLELHEQVRWHRGWSHGLFGLLLGTGIGSAILYYRYKIDWRKALWVSAAVLFFNIFVDCFNAYGTQILEPFSDTRFAMNLLFIIDPLFSVPLIIAIIGGRYLHKKESHKAPKWILTWVGISLFYVCCAGISKALVNSKFHDSLEQQAYQVQEWFSSPTPFNTLYWRSVVKVDDGYLIGYACPWDNPEQIPWTFIPHQQHVVADRMDSPGIETVVWSSFGYWTAELNQDGQPVLTDIRFGDVWFGRTGHSQKANRGVWKFTLLENGLLQRSPREVRELGSAMSFLWQRVSGAASSGL